MTDLLIVDDEATFARNASQYLERYGFATRIAGSAEEALAALRETPFDVVLLDYRLPGMDGLQAIGAVLECCPHAAVVMLTGHGSIQLAIDAIKLGARDLLTKPVSLPALRDKLIEVGATRASAPVPARPHRVTGYAALLGASEAMRRMGDKLRKAVAIDNGRDEFPLPPILIVGETGTGKELVARACHFESARRAGPFIEINCAALPEQLLESELFGYEKGAFTDARNAKTGLLEAADGGTLFLDEIGEMALALQAKILKVIEERRFRRLGAVREQTVNLRIVAATNQDLDALVASGRFRADLLFRLRVIELPLPPLRERQNDVLLLADHFLGEFAHRYRRPALSWGADARAALVRHSWPGNVRELRNLVEQCVLMSDGDCIQAADLPLVRRPLPAGEESGSRIEAMERELLRSALEKTAGNVSRAARELGISRDTLRYRLEKYGLDGSTPPKTD